MSITHKSITMRSSAMLLIAFAVGCSSDNTISSAQAVTSIDTSRPMNSLSVSEVQTLCGDLDSHLVQQVGAEHTQRNCIQAAFLAQSLSTDSNPSQVCRDSYNQCMSDAANTETTSGIGLTALCPNTPTTTSCSLTASEYINCLDQLAVAAKAAWEFRQNLCDDLVSCTGTCSSPIELPSGCVPVRETCPGMIPIVAYAAIN